MKLLSSLALTFFAVIAVMANEPMPEEIRLQNQYIEYRLMQGEIYRIYVKMNDGVTTIQFPSGISGFPSILATNLHSSAGDPTHAPAPERPVMSLPP